MPEFRQGDTGSPAAGRRVSIVIPARNEEHRLPKLAKALQKECPSGVDMETVLVDDGSLDNTVEVARSLGFEVLRMKGNEERGNPAMARNLGARESSGDPIVFLDADCLPTDGWLQTLLQSHARGETIVGGSLDLPIDLTWSARLDYYCGWYHVHSRRPAGPVPNHPPGNLSVRRAEFSETCGFTEKGAAAYAHEELGWQSELQRAGQQVYFEPTAVVLHYNRDGLGNLLRRNYRWGYSSIESKASTGAARLSSLYRFPLGLIVLSGPLALAQTMYISICWLRARVFEPLILWPLILAARAVYCVGMVVGGLRWLRGSKTGKTTPRPLWE